MPPSSDLLLQINQQHATAFVLLDRFTTSEQGAFALVDAQDGRFVLKWAPDLGMLMRYQRARQVTDQLRMLGFPAPEYVLVGCTAFPIYRGGAAQRQAVRQRGMPAKSEVPLISIRQGS